MKDQTRSFSEYLRKSQILLYERSITHVTMSRIKLRDIRYIYRLKPQGTLIYTKLLRVILNTSGESVGWMLHLDTNC